MNEQQPMDLKTYSPKSISLSHACMEEDPKGDYVDKRDALREITNLQALVVVWRDLAESRVPSSDAKKTAQSI